MTHNHEFLYRGFSNFLHVRKVQIRAMARFSATVAFRSMRSTLLCAVVPGTAPQRVPYGHEGEVPCGIRDLRLWYLAISDCALFLAEPA